MDFKELFKLSDKAYNMLKWLVLIVLPALATLVGVVGNAFNVVNLDVILTVMVAITTFLGTVIGVSSYNYNKEQ